MLTQVLSLIIIETLSSMIMDQVEWIHAEETFYAKYMNQIGHWHSF